MDAKSETSTGGDDDVLVVSTLGVSYGGVTAVNGIDMKVARGTVVAIVGPNGAGKTSFLRGVGGQERTRGSVTFDGRDITNWAPHRISRAGLAQVPQGRRLFPDLTVSENLDLGAYRRAGASERQAKVFELFPILQQRCRQHAGLLSGGEQQMLAIARALMADPTLITMDEPSLGLSPIMVSQVFETIRQISELGVSVLLVEQNATQAMKTSNYVYILNRGNLIHEGPSAEVSENVDLIAAYIG
jgi:branched-chain amino acid transport system ATP-binding protein